MGIFGIAIPMGGFVVALQYQSGGVSSILVTVGPAIIVLMAHFVLPDEGLTWLKSAGVALALGGALLLTLRGETGLRDVTQANPIGYLLVILSLTCHSMSTIYVRKYAHGYNSFDITAAQIMIGAVVIMVTVWFTQGYNFGRVESSGIWALIYGGLGGEPLLHFSSIL
ncbi:EamA family transporter [Chloroflexi bacterium TSY]|nr:EamA family transporter [Chloroflexi bacterium TSY]